MDPDCERSAMSCSGSTSLHGGRRRFFIRSDETARRLEQQSSITETQHVLPDEALETERDVKVREWKTLANERPLKFLVAGRGGVGKSSLINNLLELNSSSKEGAEEGFTGGATTQAVRGHNGSKHGIKVIAYDTPGFQDLQLTEKEIIAELVDETHSMIDVCLYCASLEMRVCQEDRRICSLLTNAFKMLWEKAIFVLTFANTEKVRRSDYEALIERYKSNLKDCLSNAGVPVNTISNITFCTTGYMDPQLEYEDCSNWQERLYVEIIKKADPAITPALLKLRWGPKAVKSAVSVNPTLQYSSCLHAI